MKHVKEVAALTGVSVRTLHHYDAIDLLKPTQVTQSGYRLYDDAALAQLNWILLFRELGFPLKQIRRILDAPEEERQQILTQQIEALEQKRTRLASLSTLARGIKTMGVNQMKPEQLDRSRLDDHEVQAKVLYGGTDAWAEYEEQSTGRTKAQSDDLGAQLMGLFTQLGQQRHLPPDDPQIQNWVAQLQAFITAHYYNCTNQILADLGKLYAGGGSMTENIDRAGGHGTADYAAAAIEVYCRVG